MAEAAHPQHDPELDVDAGSGVGETAKNPFPTSMTVPGVDGADVVVDLAVLGGVLYAPQLDDQPLSPPVRQYVMQYCAAWSSSVLTVGKLDEQWPDPPRRANVVFQESQLHAMLGLAPDERLIRTIVDQLTGLVQFVVESPRLPRLPAWDVPVPIIGLPVSAAYEPGSAAS